MSQRYPEVTDAGVSSPHAPGLLRLVDLWSTPKAPYPASPACATYFYKKTELSEAWCGPVQYSGESLQVLVRQGHKALQREDPQKAKAEEPQKPPRVRWPVRRPGGRASWVPIFYVAPACQDPCGQPGGVVGWAAALSSASQCFVMLFKPWMVIFSFVSFFSCLRKPAPLSSK